MIEIIQQYSGLINIGLFGVIIGWLFHISRLLLPAEQIRA